MTDHSSLLGQGIWLTFTAEHDETKAAQRYVELFGKPPEYILEDRRFRYAQLKLGPVPSQEGCMEVQL